MKPQYRFKLRTKVSLVYKQKSVEKLSKYEQKRILASCLATIPCADI